MARNLDTRDFSFSRVSNNFAAARTVSSALPGNHEVKVERINPFTGSTVNLRSVNAGSALGMLPSLAPTNASLITRALDHLRVAATALGFGSTEIPEFVPDPHVKETSTRGRVVNLQQYYHGVPIFQMERAVVFDHTGAIQNVSGNSVGDLPQDLDTLPSVSVEDAARKAASYLASSGTHKDSWTKQVIPDPTVDVTGYQPRVLGRVTSPAQPLILDKGPFGDNIPAHLVFFYQGPTTRLGWHFVMTLPEMTEQYVVIVSGDAQSVTNSEPAVLYCQETSSDFAAKVRGNVWTHNPGINPARQMVEFPRPLADYPIRPTPTHFPDASFPRPWVDGNPLTVGNNAIAVLGPSSNSLSGEVNGDVVTFDPGQPQGDEQKVLNIFYFCNFMHDFFYMLGFDEVSGNFQQTNFTGDGRGGDPVLARAHAGPVNGTANMLTLADGVQALMNMGLVSGINRHTAFDSDVVFHEFTHGVSNRMVGGQFDARALQQPQSRGMGEGWSDYFALTIQNCFLNPERTVLGDWVINNPRGIRLAPYDDNYPGSFGRIGQPGDYDGSDEHALGEIWCAALMKMNRGLGEALGDKLQGHLLGWQLVVDGFKHTPANPSFLDARDGILQALDARQQIGAISPGDFRSARRALWTAFSRFGMGPNARCIGASLFGIVEDRSLPPGL